MEDLSELERDLVAFERGWWKFAGAKDTAIRERFGLSPTRYYQALREVIRKPAALQHDPVTVGRLRRLEQERAVARERPGRSPEGAGNTGAGLRA